MFRLVVVGTLVIALLGYLIYGQLNPPAATYSGHVEADEIRLGSRVGGRVLQVLVQEGEVVSPGQALVRLDPFDLLERLKEAQFQLSARQAELQRVQSGFRPEEKAEAQARVGQAQAVLDRLNNGPTEQEIEAARAQVQSAAAEEQVAAENFARARELIANAAISQQELDAARERYTQGSALLRAAQAVLSELEIGTREELVREAEQHLEELKQRAQIINDGYRTEEITQAEALRDASQAAVNALQLQVQELEIVSPIAGAVEALDLQPGDLVPAGAPVISILDRSSMWVRAYIPQTIQELQVGHAVALQVDSLPDHWMQGTITFVAREAEFTPSNIQTREERTKQVYRVKISLVPEDLSKLRPGMTAEVQFDNSRMSNGR
ncbi:MAG: HlyD family efflux transporter periplasmic adaptor subunit [Planctomycetales bacterium]|nr:HlyD family efflux transporter periplasmic adaptor subunit [Planctomycetales bacterium]